MTSEWLQDYQPHDDVEAADVERIRQLVAGGGDPWSRATPLHLTGSALVLHPPSGRVLLRWHQRQGRWLQVGGHGDPGETDPLAVAVREAREETGLADLRPWPDQRLRHVVICAVQPGKGEPAHHHADLRYLLATAAPGAIRAEDAGSPLRWVTFPEAREIVGQNNLTVTLDRAERLLATG